MFQTLHFSLHQGDQCFHFFQLKNISFCGCHPKHSKWVKLGFNLDDDVINKSVQIQLQAVCFQSNTEYLVAGILVSSPSIPTNSDLPAMWWCQRQHYTLWLSLWGEASSYHFIHFHILISWLAPWTWCLSMHVCSYTQNRDDFRESKSSENSWCLWIMQRVSALFALLLNHATFPGLCFLTHMWNCSNQNAAAYSVTFILLVYSHL